MIKVLKEMPKKKTICPCCRSVLEYDQSDISKKEYHGQLDSVTVNYIMCPVCAAQIFNV